MAMRGGVALLLIFHYRRSNEIRGQGMVNLVPGSRDFVGHFRLDEVFKRRYERIAHDREHIGCDSITAMLQAEFQ